VNNPNIDLSFSCLPVVHVEVKLWVWLLKWPLSIYFQKLTCLSEKLFKKSWNGRHFSPVELGLRVCWPVISSFGFSSICFASFCSTPARNAVSLLSLCLGSSGNIWQKQGILSTILSLQNHHHNQTSVQWTGYTGKIITVGWHFV